MEFNRVTIKDKDEHKSHQAQVVQEFRIKNRGRSYVHLGDVKKEIAPTLPHTGSMTQIFRSKSPEINSSKKLENRINLPKAQSFIDETPTQKSKREERENRKTGKLRKFLNKEEKRLLKDTSKRVVVWKL